MPTSLRRLTALMSLTILALVTLPTVAQKPATQRPSTQKTLVQKPSAERPTPRLTIQDSWVREYAPFRIAGNLYYVGSEELGSYLITTPAGDILINTGAPGSDTIIRRHMEALGFHLSDIRIMLTNQAHFDHVGGMAAIKKLTGAKIMIDKGDAAVVADGGHSDFLFGGDEPLFESFKADRLLHDLDTVRLGGMEILVLHHPGHTKGSCSYLFTVKDENRAYRVLVANIPTILDETTFPRMTTYPGVMKDYAYTLDTMPKIQFDIWLAAHAGQFRMLEKHHPGDPYNPMAFADRAGYDATIAAQQKVFIRRASQVK